MIARALFLTRMKSLMKVVAKLSSVSCERDPVPTKMLSTCLESLSPVLTKKTNISGVFPASLKTARVKPLIKKSNMDPEKLKN